jgi:hypothetical protein
MYNNESSGNVAIGTRTLYSNTTGDNNTSVGIDSLGSNTAGDSNIAIGFNAMYSNTTGNGNIAIGAASSSGNFNNSILIGTFATATANNQFVVGSAGSNAGTITTESITPDKTWTVRINGVNYKIPLLTA